MVADADIPIYPTYGLNFPINRWDCAQIASSCRESWGSLPPVFLLHTAAGYIGEYRVGEMSELYDRDGVFILSSRIGESPEDIAASHDAFHAESC